MDFGDRLVAVELLEEGDDAIPAPGWRPRAAVPRRAWAAVAGLVAVGVAGWTVAGRLEDRALDARLAAVDGLSAPLEAPLSTVWRVPGAKVLAAVDDSVLVQDTDRAGVRAVDVADGTVRYARPGFCELVPTNPGATWRPDVHVLEADAADLLLCVEPVGPEGAHPTAQVATARVHHPSTGALLRSIDLGPGATWAPIGTDLVSIGVGADGHVTAGRWSLLTGEPVWSYRSPTAVARNVASSSSMDESFVRLEIGGWRLTLDATTGERVGRSRWGALRGDAGWGPVPLPDGASAVSRFSPGGTETTVLEPDGSERFCVPGFLLTPVVDDATVPGTLLVVRADPERGPRRLVALDAADGTELWQSAARLGQVAFLRGSVVVHDSGGLTALDGVDGAVRWDASADDRGDSGSGMATDGRRVLTLDTVRGVSSLTARDLVTGTPVWSAEAPVGDASLALLPDGTVIAAGRAEMIALRPDGGRP